MLALAVCNLRSQKASKDAMRDVFGSDLLPTAKVVLLWLMQRGESEFCLSHLEIGGALNLHRNSVRTVMKSLEDGGWIQATDVRKSNVQCYRILDQ